MIIMENFKTTGNPGTNNLKRNYCIGLFSNFPYIFSKFFLSDLVKDPTCFKIRDKPSCIDLFLTNRPQNFKNVTKKADISDFYKFVFNNFKKEEPKIFQDEVFCVI